MYKLLWRGEVIEECIQTLEEAEYLKAEYQIAYGGTVRILKQRRCKGV